MRSRTHGADWLRDLDDDTDVASRIRQHARSMRGQPSDFTPLEPLVHDASLVLVGDATHGSHELYAERARLTKWLLSRGFTDVAVEADWPDAGRVTRFVTGQSVEDELENALGDFDRFPRWMWRNTAVRDFVAWLRGWNAVLPERERAGFYGVDLYSLHRSMHAVVDHLDRTDPDAAGRARDRYACFDTFGEDPQRYGRATEMHGLESCEDDVVEQLHELHSSRTRVADTHDEAFFAEQNARLAKNAEAYYRAMFRSSNESWNLRDTHFMQTLDALSEHLAEARGKPARLVVWAHCSHVGDARATDMGGSRGQLNVGQLAREARGEGAVLIGTTTHHGTVAAASDWGYPVQRKHVRRALPSSWESVLHQVGLPRFLVTCAGPLAETLSEPRVERAIGVIYRPETERASHYYRARIGEQFDAFLHVDVTHAVQPLDEHEGWALEDLPETYPSGY